LNELKAIISKNRLSRSDSRYNLRRFYTTK